MAPRGRGDAAHVARGRAREAAVGAAAIVALGVARGRPAVRDAGAAEGLAADLAAALARRALVRLAAVAARRAALLARREAGVRRDQEVEREHLRRERRRERRRLFYFFLRSDCNRQIDDHPVLCARISALSPTDEPLRRLQKLRLLLLVRRRRQVRVDGAPPSAAARQGARAAREYPSALPRRAAADGQLDGRADGKAAADERRGARARRRPQTMRRRELVGGGRSRAGVAGRARGDRARRPAARARARAPSGVRAAAASAASPYEPGGSRQRARRARCRAHGRRRAPRAASGHVARAEPRCCRASGRGSPPARPVEARDAANAARTRRQPLARPRLHRGSLSSPKLLDSQCLARRTRAAARCLPRAAAAALPPRSSLTTVKVAPEPAPARSGTSAGRGGAADLEQAHHNHHCRAPTGGGTGAAPAASPYLTPPSQHAALHRSGSPSS